MEISGLSVGADLGKEASASLVADTRKVIDRLVEKKLLTEFTDRTEFKANDFYQGNGAWRHGLYYITSGYQTIVIYVVWRKSGSTLLLLFGSPANMIGSVVAKEGQYVSTTGDALDCVGHGRIRKELEREPEMFSADESIQIERGESNQERSDSRQVFLYAPALELANFCQYRLMGLPVSDMTIAFRSIARHETDSGSLLEDIKKAYSDWQKRERERTLAPFEKSNPELRREIILAEEENWQATIRRAESSGWTELDSVCVGSPLYTALG